LKKIVLLVLAILLSISLVTSVIGCGSKDKVTLNVSAAASLTDVLKEINGLYTQQKSNVSITPNFASSGTLQQQIQAGAPCDFFLSAGASQMDALQKDNLILVDTRKNLLMNKVVLIVPNDSKIELSDFNGLLSKDIKKIAIGDPASTPLGKYAEQAFDQLGISSQIESKLILCSDVRQVLAYVESGNVDAGIVFSTDALISNKVKVITEAPAEVNAKIVYPVAVIKASKHQGDAKDYEDFLFSDKIKAVFEKYGFTVVGN
jgi:molybdate transport system substrate-binding protein